MLPEVIKKAIELKSQFGVNAKYVCIEVIENLKWLEDSCNFEKAFKFWRAVKEELENNH